MRYFIAIISIAAVVVLLSLSQRLMNPSQFNVISVEAFSDTLSKDSSIQLVDVRTVEEFNSGHIPNAIVIDITSPSFDSIAKSVLDPSRPVALYCRSGVRSKQASERLSELGYKGFELDGGITNWNNHK